MAKRVRTVARITPMVALLTVTILLAIAGSSYLALGGSARYHSSKLPAELRFAHATPRFDSVETVLEADEPGPTPNPNAVLSKLNSLLSVSELGNLGVSIVDDDGTSLVNQNGNTTYIPASTTKLATVAAALQSLGPTATFATRVVVGAQPGQIVLIGGGDPTISAQETGPYLGAASMVELANRVSRQAESPITSIVVDSSLFTGATTHPSWDADSVSGGYVAPISALMVDGGRDSADGRSNQPDIAAGRALAQALGLSSAVVSRGAASTGATELGRVESPSVATLAEWTLRESDNVLAEVLARQVAITRHQEPDFAGAAIATKQSLTQLGITSEVSLSDASGLSRDNRIAPTALSELLTIAASPTNSSVLRPMLSGLAIAGFDGTLNNRFESTNTAGAGVVRAKTGTLSGVAGLAGTVYTASGQLILFVLIANNADDGSARESLDRIAATLATCGC